MRGDGVAADPVLSVVVGAVFGDADDGVFGLRSGG